VRGLMSEYTNSPASKENNILFLASSIGSVPIERQNILTLNLKHESYQKDCAK